MKSFIEHARMYSVCHQNKMTLYTHLASIPIILLSVMIFLGFIKIVIPHVLTVSVSTLAVLGLLAYYYRIDWKLALIITPVLLILLWISCLFNHNGPSALGIWGFVLTAIIGSLLHFYGHFTEEKKPALKDYVTLAPMAPLFLTAEALFMLGFMSGLKEQIHNEEHAKQS